MSFTTVLATLVLVLGVPLNLYVSVRLWRLSRMAPDVPLLRERAIVSVAVFLLVLVFGIVFLNNDVAVPFLRFEDTKLYTRLAMLAVAIIPATYWLILTRDPDEQR